MVNNESLEQSFLGALLTNCEELHGITEDNFQNADLKKVFKAIEYLHQHDLPIDIVTVSERLKETFEFDGIGNQKLVELTDGIYTSSNIAYYANRIKKETRNREVLKIASYMMDSGKDGMIESGEIIEYADKLLSLNNLDSSEYSLDSIMEETAAYLNDRQGKTLFGWSFGENMKFLDQYTKGIQKGRTYRIGAVSNLGKSQLAYNMITNLLDQGAKVAFFTLENEKSFTITNILANKQRVNSHSIENGEEMPNFQWLNEHKDRFFLIDEEYELSRIFARILEIKPDVVFIDYIGLINIHKVKEEEMYTSYARRVQSFVKKTKISLIDLSNLPKDADEDNIRLYGGYYGSSFLRNNTDVGIHMFYYAPYYKWKKEGMNMDESMRNIQVVTMLISKNRIGTAKVEQVFKLDFNRGGFFTPATEQELALWNF